MSRRVKLITEWATWCRDDNKYRLMGANDHAAVIYMFEEPVVYLYVATYSVLADTWEYGNIRRYDLPTGTTVQAALDHCESRLVEIGLIDPLWWVSKCEE